MDRTTTRVVSLIIFVFCLPFQSIFALPELEKPTLLLQSDIPAKGRDVAERIRKSYVFLADFNASDPKYTPKGWVKDYEKPHIAINFGKPERLERPDINIEYMQFALGALNYFQGDDEVTEQLNLAVSYWRNKRYQDTYNQLEKLKEMAKTLPLGHVPALASKLFRAQFHLFATLQPNVKVQSKDGALITRELHHHFAQGILWESLAKLDFAQIATSLDKTVDLEIYNSFWKNPFVLLDTELMHGKPFQMQLLERAIDPMVWVRSVALHSYWSVTVGLRQFKAWAQFYTASERFEIAFERLALELPQAMPTAAIEKLPNPRVEDAVRVHPKNHRDMLAALHVAIATVEFQNDDPLSIFKFADLAIQEAISPDLAAFAFHVAGALYLDFNKYSLARRVYGWAEAMSARYTAANPSLLLFGAEAAFWNGDYEIARKALEKFLLVSGDSEYGPRARLRLAEIAQIQGKASLAEEKYENLVRYHPQHSVSKDAAVRLFCQTAKNLNTRTLTKEYNKVSKYIRDARDDLKSQAKACMLRVDLADLSDMSSAKPEDVKAEAQKQLEAIEAYEKEFPESEFLQLFADRVQKLKLSETVFQGSQAQCATFIKTYKDNQNALEKLGKSQKHILPSLVWTTHERQLLMRCAVIVRDVPLLKQLSKTDAKSDGANIQKPLVDYITRGNETNAIKLFDAVRLAKPSEWGGVVLKSERIGNKLIRENDFWRSLAVRNLAEFELSRSPKEKKQFLRHVTKYVLKNSSSLFESEMLCQWTLSTASNFVGSQWDAVARSQTPEQWKAHIQNKKVTCVTRLARELVGASLTKPSGYRDARILEPILEQTGLAESSEHWLHFAKRRAEMYGPLDEKAKSIFARLQSESPNVTVKAAAKAWIEENVNPDTSLL